jgi:hypothetical protein
MAGSSEKQESRVIHIRPYQVLYVPDGFSEEITFFMPLPEAAGSLTTIESIMLLKLMRLSNPTYLFEFGTYKGLTTRLLLENLPDKPADGERVYTLDLPGLENIAFQGSDEQIAREAQGFERKYLRSRNKHLVKQLLQDSMELDPGLYLNKFQFIFIDGNHERSFVKNDTEKAFKMAAAGPSCIVWHDYGNPEFPELTDYLDGLSVSMCVHHIEDTMLAFHIEGVAIATRKP